MLLLQAKMRYRFGKRLDTFSVSGKKRIDSIVAVQNDKAQSPATLMDVAKEAQVSIATASRVLNGSTRKVRNQSYVKVMEAATKLNYRPNAYAQAVAKGTAPNIVLLVSDISDPYFASVSQGVVKAAAERGISVTIGVAATPHEELEAVRKSVSTSRAASSSPKVNTPTRRNARRCRRNSPSTKHPADVPCSCSTATCPSRPWTWRTMSRARHRKADRRFRVYAPCDSQGR